MTSLQPALRPLFSWRQAGPKCRPGAAWPAGALAWATVRLGCGWAAPREAEWPAERGKDTRRTSCCRNQTHRRRSIDSRACTTRCTGPSPLVGRGKKQCGNPRGGFRRTTLLRTTSQCHHLQQPTCKCHSTVSPRPTRGTGFEGRGGISRAEISPPRRNPKTAPPPKKAVENQKPWQ